MMSVSILLAAVAPQAAAVLPPEQAIARADAEPGKGVNGTFEMRVAVVARTSNAIYLIPAWI